MGDTNVKYIYCHIHPNTRVCQPTLSSTAAKVDSISLTTDATAGRANLSGGASSYKWLIPCRGDTASSCIVHRFVYSRERPSHSRCRCILSRVVVEACLYLRLRVWIDDERRRVIDDTSVIIQDVVIVVSSLVTTTRGYKGWRFRWRGARSRKPRVVVEPTRSLGKREGASTDVRVDVRLDVFWGLGVRWGGVREQRRRDSHSGRGVRVEGWTAERV